MENSSFFCPNHCDNTERLTLWVNMLPLNLAFSSAHDDTVLFVVLLLTLRFL